MEILQLRYFCDAARSENFSKTAEKFFVPASNISQSIKRLERELGVELFRHRANRVTLAEAGRQFYSKAVTALSLLDEARIEATSRGSIGGEIKLKILCNRGQVTEAIESFKREYPQVGFVLSHGQGAEEDYDIVITDKCPGGYYEYRLLAEEKILLAISGKHHLASKAALGVGDLRGERFICMPKGRSLYSITERICNEAGFSPGITIQTDDPYYVRKYVELGLGIAFVPELSWHGQFSSDVALLDIGAHTRKTYVCLRAGDNIKPSVSVFLKYLCKE